MRLALQDPIVRAPWPREVRCRCHKLICVQVGDTVEIKCNKCKRVVVIETRGVVRIRFRDDDSPADAAGA